MHRNNSKWYSNHQLTPVHHNAHLKCDLGTLQLTPSIHHHSVSIDTWAPPLNVHHCSPLLADSQSTLAHLGPWHITLALMTCTPPHTLSVNTHYLASALMTTTASATDSCPSSNICQHSASTGTCKCITVHSQPFDTCHIQR